MQYRSNDPESIQAIFDTEGDSLRKAGFELPSQDDQDFSAVPEDFSHTIHEKDPADVPPLHWLMQWNKEI